MGLIEFTARINLRSDVGARVRQALNSLNSSIPIQAQLSIPFGKGEAESLAIVVNIRYSEITDSRIHLRVQKHAGRMGSVMEERRLVGSLARLLYTGASSNTHSNMVAEN